MAKKFVAKNERELQSHIDKKVGQVMNKLPQDERVAIGLGFYQMDGKLAEELDKDQYDNFFGFNDYPNDDTPDSTTSVNGDFGTEGEWNGLTEFQNFSHDIESDDDFDNLFTKKSRRKLSKGFKKITKKLSIKNIKKGLTLKSIGRGIKKAGKQVVKGVKKVGKAIGKGIKAVANVIKHAVLFLPRQAARGLIALNYRGVAYKLAYQQKNNKSKWKKIESKWRKLGGKNSWLKSAINKGKNKKALFCGAKCKKKLAKQTAKKKNFAGHNFLNANGSANYGNYELDPTKLMRILKETPIQTDPENPEEFHNVVCAGACVTGVMVGLGGSIIGGLATYLSSVPANKALKQQVKDAKTRDDKELKLMAKQQGISKKQAEDQLKLMEMKVKDELNPVNQILNNPNLSPAEKKEAVKQVEQALDTKAGRKKSKLLLVGAMAIIGLIAVVFLAKKN